MAGHLPHSSLQPNPADLVRPADLNEATDFDRGRATHAKPAAPVRDPAPEVPPGAEDLVTWNVSPEEAGHLIPEIEADDEADVAADMAEEGSGEAEQELRRAATTEAG